MRRRVQQAIKPVQELLELTQISLKRQLAWLVIGIVFVALTESLGFLLLVPLLKLASGDPTPHVGFVLGAFVLISLARIWVGYQQRIATIRIQLGAKDALRIKVYDALLRSEWRWLSRARSEDHSQILISAIGQICGTGISQLVGFCAALCLLTGYLAASLFLSWQITLVGIAVAFGLGLLLRGQQRLARRQGVLLVEASRAMFGLLKGGLGQLRELKISEGEDRFLSQFDRVNASFSEQQFAFDRRNARIRAASQFGLVSAILAVIWLSLTWWKLSLVELAPAVFLIIRIAPMLANLQVQYDDWQKTVPLIASTRALLNESRANAEQAGDADHAPLPLQTAIELKNVQVRYAGRDRPALAGVSCVIPARTTTFIAGRSGSGKSTLADVLMGLIEPDSGVLLVDGQPISGAWRQRWRNAVGYVQQQPTLFDDTIRGNLLWGQPDASEAELNHVLELAAASFVHRLPQGLDTRVGEEGVQLSGGERQRIALARVLLRRPSLLILDEATSALDKDSEAAINQAIAGLGGQMTIIVIAHRFAAGARADQTITLHDGAMVPA